MIPAGLRAWARGVRAEARGGNGNGLLGWCRKALPAYTWCQSDTECMATQDRQGGCKCGEVMTGTHVVEECSEIDQWRPRRAVWKEWKEALGGGAVIKKKAEEEGDLLGNFFFLFHFRYRYS